MSGYDQLSKSIEQQLADIESPITQKSAMAEAAIKDLKPKIDKAIADFDDALQQQTDAAKTAWDSSLGKRLRIPTQRRKRLNRKICSTLCSRACRKRWTDR